MEGLTGPHHQFMLTLQPRHLDQLGEMIELFDAEIERCMHPLLDAIARLDGIPSVGVRSAKRSLPRSG